MRIDNRFEDLDVKGPLAGRTPGSGVGAVEEVGGGVVSGEGVGEGSGGSLVVAGVHSADTEIGDLVGRCGESGGGEGWVRGGGGGGGGVGGFGEEGVDNYGGFELVHCWNGYELVAEYK